MVGADEPDVAAAAEAVGKTSGLEMAMFGVPTADEGADCERDCRVAAGTLRLIRSARLSGGRLWWLDWLEG